MPLKEQDQAADIVTSLNAAFARIFPSASPDSLEVRPETIAAVALMRDEIAAAVKKASKATLTNSDLDRISEHNPQDPE